MEAGSKTGYEQAVERIQHAIDTRASDLDISGLGLTELPELITKAKYLVSVDCSKNFELADLSPLSGLTSLRQLNCSSANISDLSPLSRLTSLQQLEFWRTPVSDLSPLSELIALQQLDVGVTRVSDLSPLSGLTALRQLNCISTNISDLSPLSGLTALQRLDCSDNPVIDLSPLSGLTALQRLDCSGNPVSDLSPLSGLTALQQLDCRPTKISDLSPLGGLISLKQLSFWGIQVSDLSPLGGLTALQQLDCRGTQISDLSPLGGLTALQQLDCRGTQISDLSPLSGLISLQKLNCSGTQISDLSPLSGLTGLQKVDARFLETPLDCSPEAEPLKSLVNLETLYISRLAIAPQLLASEDYIDNALPRIRRWQQDVTESGAAAEKVIKVLILGNGRVGKTQLRRRLTGQGYDMAIKSTHGIEVEDIVGEFYDDSDTPLRFKIWDFGGQDIYLNTHSLFLDQQAICVIAWHPDYENTQEVTENGVVMRNRPLNYWLEYVRNFAGANTPVILAQTRCEKQSQCQDAPVFRDHGFNWLQRTHSSAIKPRGVRELATKLEHAASYLLEQHGQVLIPNSWAALSRQLQDRRGEKVLSLDAFRAMCRHFSEVDVSKVLLQYYHRNGEVFWQQQAFDGQVVLDLSWSFSGIYALFERQDVYPVLVGNKGLFKPSLLKNTVWKDYSDDECELFLHMMQQCQICFRLSDYSVDWDKADYLLPQALPDYQASRHAIEQIWQQANVDAEVELRFPFLSDGVAQSMLSALGQHTRGHAFYWAYGCCFYDANTRAKALITTDIPDVDSSETFGCIRIQTSGGNGQGLIEILLDGFLKLNPFKAPETHWVTRPSPEAEPIRQSRLESGSDKKQTVFDDISAEIMPDILSAVLEQSGTGQQNKPIVQIFLGGANTMGNSYTNKSGQVSAMGDQASASHNHFQQVNHNHPLDSAALAAELERLRTELKSQAQTLEQEAAVGEVAAAQVALGKGDNDEAFKRLKATGQWALDTATKIGTNVAAAVIKDGMGY